MAGVGARGPLAQAPGGVHGGAAGLPAELHYGVRRVHVWLVWEARPKARPTARTMFSLLSRNFELLSTYTAVYLVFRSAFYYCRHDPSVSPAGLFLCPPTCPPNTLHTDRPYIPSSTWPQAAPACSASGGGRRVSLHCDSALCRANPRIDGRVNRHVGGARRRLRAHEVHEGARRSHGAYLLWPAMWRSSHVSGRTAVTMYSKLPMQQV